MGVPIRACVAGLPAYKAGKPAGGQRKTFKLSSNENPYPPLPGVLEAAQQSCKQMNRYPDMGNSEALTALTEYLRLHNDGLPVTEDNLAFGTGSVAVLYHLLQAVCDPGDEVVYAWRSFEAYPIAVQACGAVPVQVPLRADCSHDLPAMAAAVNPRTRAVLLCTPNNPTSTIIRHDELVDFLDRIPPEVLVVLDEAYVEFATDPGVARGLELWRDRPNVVVLRTFSKAYGLAGFRVGYAVAEPRLATAIRAVALPFGVSVPAQAAVVASLNAADALMERVAALVAARTELVDGLTGLGFTLPSAEANFVWFGAREQTAAYAAAFEAAGLITRPYIDGGQWDGVRVSVGEPEANARILEVAATLLR